MTLLNKDDDFKVESCCVTSDARHPRVCLRKNKDTQLEMARLSPFVPFGGVLTFQAWLWPSRPVFSLVMAFLVFFYL